MNEDLFNKLKKIAEAMLREEIEIETEEPEIETEEPEAPSIPVPGKKRHPLKPDKGVSPEPKNKDVELFKMYRKDLLHEAFDPGEFPDFVHKSKKAYLRTGDEQLNNLLPHLSGTEQTYLEMITSNSYKEMLRRLEHYTGIKASKFSVPQLVSLLFQSLSTVMDLESGHESDLEKMAMNTVLELPEFEMVKDAYENGDVKFDVKLETGPAPGPKVKSDEMQDSNLSELEELNVELADAFEELHSEMQIRRRLANLMIQGSATLKTYLFNMVNDEISKIDKRLPNLYGILGVCAQLGYWITPEGIEQAAKEGGLSAGEEQVIPDGDDYIIKVRAITFPYLVHELVKGIYEWISIDPDVKSAMKSVDTLKGETSDIIVGPELFKIVSSYLGKSKEHLMPLIHKKLLQLPKEDVREVFGKTAKGKEIMNSLADEAEDEWGEYRREQI